MKSWSEKQAFKPARNKAIIATKFGMIPDAGINSRPEHVRNSVPVNPTPWLIPSKAFVHGVREGNKAFKTEIKRARLRRIGML